MQEKYATNASNATAKTQIAKMEAVTILALRLLHSLRCKLCVRCAGRKLVFGASVAEICVFHVCINQPTNHVFTHNNM